ncbi:MAG TPA: ribokinase [Trueperaceae bacterium]
MPDGPGLVTVVGSLNMDLVVRVERHPLPGETVLGRDHAEHPGGKGANQAVAAARTGAPVRMVGRVGDDAHGRALQSSLTQAGVDVSGVRTGNARTGVAFIQVDDGGQNTIVVSPGANAELVAGDLDAVDPRTEVLMLQLEVPWEVSLSAARLARRSGASVVLNLAPARSLAAADLRDVTHLIVNEHEAGVLLSVAADEVAAGPVAAARRLTDRVPAVVITLGAKGAAFATRGGSEGTQPAFGVRVVDTTAAGDAFAGALASRLASGETDLAAAVRYACAAGSLATSVWGAQPSLPTAQAIERLLAG